MTFARLPPERAFEAKSIRFEDLLSDREQLLSTIAVLCDAMDESNYDTSLEWRLAMTLVRAKARKLLNERAKVAA